MKRTSSGLLIHLIPDYFKTTIKLPDIQRDSKVWTLEQKQNLIDSLYNDFDIPKIYFRRVPEQPEIWWLIDGQQRLTTIKEFLSNEFDLGSASTLPSEIHEKKFKQLAPTDKAKITGRSLDCVIVECDDEEEEDLFTRLNNGTPLSAAEKRNAIQGQIRDSVKQLAKHKFFRYKVKFSPKRFAHDAVSAQLTALCLAGEATDTKGKALKKLYDAKRTYPEKREVETKIKKILNLMDKIFVNKEPYLKKYNIVSIYLFLQELLDSYAVSRITPKHWFDFFNDFETRRTQNSQISEDDPSFDYDLNEYQLSCVNSPDSEQGIKIRHDILLKKFFSKFVSIEPKDPTRNFSDHQKQAIFLLGGRKCRGVAGFTCPNSNKLLPFEECQFDHIKEHNEGGLTTVSNGQILCMDCHTHKTSKYRAQLRA